MCSLLKSDLRIVFNYWRFLQEGACLRSLFKRRNLMQKSLGKVSKLLMRPSLMTSQPHVSKSDSSHLGRAACHPRKMTCEHPFKFSMLSTSELHEHIKQGDHICQNAFEEVLKLQHVFFLIQYNVNIQNKTSISVKVRNVHSY